MRSFARAAVCAAVALSLSACLISDQPLLDPANAGAAPLEPGSYESCERDDDGDMDDCAPLDIAREDGVYRLQPLDDEEATLALFRPIGGGAFLAQMWGESDSDYFYFYADAREGALRLVMIECADLPEKLRASLSRRGALEIDDGGETCVAKTLNGAEAAARAYKGARGIAPRSVLVLTKAAE